MTKTERIIKFIQEKHKMIEVKSPSRKYRKFMGQNSKGKTITWWVGRKGGVRSGAASSKSYSITDLIALDMKRCQEQGEVGDEKR